jgi:glyoxylase I family protein
MTLQASVRRTRDDSDVAAPADVWTCTTVRRRLAGVLMPDLVAFSHVDLTVTDAERSVRWWHDVLGFELVHTSDQGTHQVWSLMHPGGLNVNLMTHSVRPADRFDERVVGLDHLSFKASDRSELEQWVAHFDALGVDHSGVVDAHFGSTLVFRDPDNIQLELFVHPTAADLESLIATDPAAS